MATERQIEANRRNAQKSKGPKSQAGKMRSSKNAYRHGLAVPIERSAIERGELARRFAGDSSNAEILTLAERAADAHFELDRVGKMKAALIERAWKCCSSRSISKLNQFRFRQSQSTTNPEGAERELQDLLAALSAGGRENGSLLNDAVSVVLSELVKTVRYEKRATSRRDRAIYQIVSLGKADGKYTFD